MSRNQKALNSLPKDKPERTSQEQERIDNALLLMTTRLGRALSLERITLWHSDLASYPIEGIEWAFDCWGLNGHRLPTCADIVQLLATWHVEQAPEETCECSDRHGKGYHTNDIMWLWKERMKYAEPWTEQDYEDALDRLDKIRAGGPPEWRKSA